jgi:hypothetical protein
MTFHKWNQFLWMIVTLLNNLEINQKKNGSAGDECDPIQ